MGCVALWHTQIYGQFGGLRPVAPPPWQDAPRWTSPMHRDPCEQWTPPMESTTSVPWSRQGSKRPTACITPWLTRSKKPSSVGSSTSWKIRVVPCFGERLHGCAFVTFFITLLFRLVPMEGAGPNTLLLPLRTLRFQNFAAAAPTVRITFRGGCHPQAGPRPRRQYIHYLFASKLPQRLCKSSSSPALTSITISCVQPQDCSQRPAKVDQSYLSTSKSWCSEPHYKSLSRPACAWRGSMPQRRSL